MLLVKSYQRHIIHAVNESESIGRFLPLTICGKRPKQTTHEGSNSDITCNECKTILKQIIKL